MATQVYSLYNRLINPTPTNCCTGCFYDKYNTMITYINLYIHSVRSIAHDSINIQQWVLLSTLIGLLLGGCSTTTWAQDQATSQDSLPTRKLTKRERDYLAMVEYRKTVYKVSKLSREEKNTIASCPLHNSNREMPLSDSYRANASDYTTCYEYPFAYQLNYRRYCKVCTRIMSKDSNTQLPRITRTSATFQRCEVHNTPLKGNPDYDRIQYERNPAGTSPHARQYLYKYFCKTCTKTVKQQE